MKKGAKALNLHHLTCKFIELLFQCACVLSSPPAPLSMEFSWQKYWIGCHFLLQGIFLMHTYNLHLLWLLHWQLNSLALRYPYNTLEIPGNHSLRITDKTKQNLGLREIRGKNTSVSMAASYESIIIITMYIHFCNTSLLMRKM